MKKLLCICLTIVLILPMTSNKIMAWEDSKSIFDDVDKLTSEEIVAEMKYAVSTGNEGKYYPKDRLHQLEQQLAKIKQPKSIGLKSSLKMMLTLPNRLNN